MPEASTWEEQLKQFLLQAANKGELVNTLFEERLFGLIGVLHSITNALDSQGIPHELIGGLAVLVYVEEANPELSALTRDVDLMIHRSDLDRIKTAAASAGFRFRHTAGLDMLIYGPAESARNAVHLLFSGEKVNPAQATPNPAITPVHKQIQGKDVMVIPLPDLVRMKLSSYRLKDQVHIQTLDASGLITPEVEKSLTSELLVRLDHIRATP
jgi:hypothetical protein